MTVTWQRRSNLKKKIEVLPNSVAMAVRQAMEEAAQTMVEKMQNLVPVDSGDLKDSIGWSWGSAPDRAMAITSLGGPEDKSDMRIVIYAGSEKAYYAKWVEFGTKARAPGKYHTEGSNHARNAGAHGHRATHARPFFWPTWRLEKKRIRARMARKINAAIKKLASAS